MKNLIKLVIGVFISAILRINAAFAVVVIGEMFGIQIPITYAIVGTLSFAIASIKYDVSDSDASMDNLIKSSIFCSIMPWMITLTAFLISLFI